MTGSGSCQALRQNLREFTSSIGDPPNDARCIRMLLLALADNLSAEVTSVL